MNCIELESQSITLHASRRLAHEIVRVLDSPCDLQTLQAWARFVGVGVGTLRTWCRSAGVTGKDALDLGRVLRAVIRARDVGWEPYNLLDIVDSRTLRRLLDRAGLSREPNPSVSIFLHRQAFVRSSGTIHEIHRLLMQTDTRADFTDVRCDVAQIAGS